MNKNLLRYIVAACLMSLTTIYLVKTKTLLDIKKDLKDLQKEKLGLEIKKLKSEIRKDSFKSIKGEVFKEGEIK